jgi:hypothetical protein
MKQFRDLREDKFDKSKEKNVDQLAKKLQMLSVHVSNLEKLDKQGEGKGEMAKDLKVFKAKYLELQKALTKIENRLV